MVYETGAQEKRPIRRFSIFTVVHMPPMDTASNFDFQMLSGAGYGVLFLNHRASTVTGIAFRPPSKAIGATSIIRI